MYALYMDLKQNDVLWEKQLFLIKKKSKVWHTWWKHFVKLIAAHAYALQITFTGILNFLGLLFSLF